MRVAYISWAPFISGAERSLQTTLRVMPDCGIEPVVVCPPGSAIVPWCRANDVAVVECPLARRDKWHPLRWWRSLRELRRCFREQRIDLVHSNQLWSYPAAGTAAGQLGLPRVCHFRDETSREAVRWWCAAGVEQVICISQHIQRQVSAAWADGPHRPQIATMINPVTMPQDLSPGEQSQAAAAARRELGAAEDAVLLGFIGQITRVKGLLELLDVLSTLKDNGRWQLLVAGRDRDPGAPYEDACRRRVEELGLDRQVRFLGFLENAEPFYRAIDLAVVPSLEEPLGRIPLEAGAYGKPSLAFATGGLPETIQDGRTGWLVPPGDLDALRGALASFLRMPAKDKDIGLQARQWVAQICCPETYGAKLAEIYRSLRT